MNTKRKRDACLTLAAILSAAAMVMLLFGAPGGAQQPGYTAEYGESYSVYVASARSIDITDPQSGAINGYSRSEAWQDCIARVNEQRSQTFADGATQPAINAWIAGYNAALDACDTPSPPPTTAPTPTTQPPNPLIIVGVCSAQQEQQILQIIWQTDAALSDYIDDGGIAGTAEWQALFDAWDDASSAYQECLDSR